MQVRVYWTLTGIFQLQIYRLSNTLKGEKSNTFWLTVSFATKTISLIYFSRDNVNSVIWIYRSWEFKVWTALVLRYLNAFCENAIISSSNAQPKYFAHAMYTLYTLLISMIFRNKKINRNHDKGFSCTWRFSHSINNCSF